MEVNKSIIDYIQTRHYSLGMFREWMTIQLKKIEVKSFKRGIPR